MSISWKEILRKMFVVSAFVGHGPKETSEVIYNKYVDG